MSHGPAIYLEIFVEIYSLKRTIVIVRFIKQRIKYELFLFTNNKEQLNTPFRSSNTHVENISILFQEGQFFQSWNVFFIAS